MAGVKEDSDRRQQRSVNRRVMARPIPLGEVVELDFRLPFGPVTIHTAARQRTAFRYGFQFLQSEPATDVIQRTCERLASEQTNELGCSQLREG